MIGLAQKPSATDQLDRWFEGAVDRFRSRTPRSSAAFDEASRLIPGGVIPGTPDSVVPLPFNDPDGAETLDFGLHWTETPVTDFDTTQASDREVISRLILNLYNEGFLMFRAGTDTLTAAMTHDDVDSVLRALDASLRESGLGG
ncbi:hypothetical protein [Pseudonocardia xishanensis]|uniref:Uncharacterized protein n=1 Tax=Pseudonocardia xishanensis TaxID=630995 RepID=A0ABP8RZB9_9PSEU